jgi:hypothetical protein
MKPKQSRAEQEKEEPYPNVDGAAEHTCPTERTGDEEEAAAAGGAIDAP